MGLGLLGRGLGDAVFLAEHGAELIVTDLRDEKTLAPSREKIEGYKNIRYTLGEHKFEDFRNRDFILKAAGIPLDSSYIAEAQRNGIPIEMDASLFAKLAPKGVVLVGVTGTRGKSTTTALIYEILSAAMEHGTWNIEHKNRKVYRGGNLVAEATLPLIEKVKAGDIVVLELDSWQLQGFHDAKLSPQVSVFTTFLDDHLIYYKGNTDRYFEDKVGIFKYQKPGNLLVVGERVAPLVAKSGVPIQSDVVVAAKEDVPKSWNIPIPGEHNLENISCALQVAAHFKVPLEAVKNAIENFKAVPGRLEFLREVWGVKIYNDNNATTPDATIAALRALHPKSEILNSKQIPNSRQSQNLKISKSKNIILIMGGTDKGLDMSKLISSIPEYCKAVVLLNETGTDKLIFNYQFPIFKKDTLKECVDEAMKLAKKGDTVLFSPAFASFGKWFKNEYDRGAQFVNEVNQL